MEDSVHGPEQWGDELPEELRRREGRLERASDVRGLALKLTGLDVRGARAQ